MPLITKFYDDYLIRSDNELSVGRENLDAFLQENLSQENFMQAEDLVTSSEDSACEKAFTAGFKSAMALLMEVLA